MSQGRTPLRGAELRRRHRLRRSADFLRCYRRGGKRRGTLATVHFHPNEHPDVRLGVTASRKVGKSVVRHRVKRRVREIFRRWTGRRELAAMDVVVHLWPGAGEAEYGALRAELEQLLASLGPRERRTTPAPAPPPRPARGAAAAAAERRARP